MEPLFRAAAAAALVGVVTASYCHSGAGETGPVCMATPMEFRLKGRLSELLLLSLDDWREIRDAPGLVMGGSTNGNSVSRTDWLVAMARVFVCLFLL